MKTFARGETSNVSVNTVGGGGGGSAGGGNRAPDVFPPSIGRGMDCRAVGRGAARSGTECNKRKVAAFLSELFGTGVARVYAVKNIGGEDPR